MSRDRYRIFTALLIIGGIIFGIFLYREGLADFQWWWFVAILVSIIFIYGVSALTQRWSIARQLAKIPDSHGPYVWTIDAEAIRISGALSSSSIKWAAVTKVRETRIDFLFYQAPKFARFLPKRALTGEQVGELRRLITECVPGKAKLISE